MEPAWKCSGYKLGNWNNLEWWTKCLAIPPTIFSREALFNNKWELNFFLIVVEAERENSYWRDQRSASRGREHKRRPFDRQEENWQQGGRQPGGRQRQTDRYGYPMEEASYRRRRSSSSTFSSQEERYLQEKQHPYKQRGGRNRGGASAPPKNKGKPPPPPKTGRGAKKGKDKIK